LAVYIIALRDLLCLWICHLRVSAVGYVYGSVTFAFLPLGVFFCVSVCFKTSLTHWKKLKKKHSAVSFEHHWRNSSPLGTKHKNIEIMLCRNW